MALSAGLRSGVSLKYKVASKNKKHKVLIYRETLKIINPSSSFDLEHKLINSISRAKLYLNASSGTMEDLGITLETSGEMAYESSLKQTQQIKISDYLYERINELKGDLSIQDFLEIIVEYIHTFDQINLGFITKLDDTAEETPHVEEPGGQNYTLNDDSAQNYTIVEEGESLTNSLLWGLGVGFFGVGDILTTLLSVQSGNTEMNPLTNWLLSINPWTFVSFKVMILSALYLLYSKVATKTPLDNSRRIIPISTTLFGVFLTVNNILVLYGYGSIFRIIAVVLGQL